VTLNAAADDTECQYGWWQMYLTYFVEESNLESIIAKHYTFIHEQYPVHPIPCLGSVSEHLHLAGTVAYMSSGG
jgi:hypothetical protein